MLSVEYRKTRNVLTRTVVAGSLKGVGRLRLPTTETSDRPPSHLWWQYILRGALPDVGLVGSIRSIDLFCGAGGLSLGASKATEAVGMNLSSLAAADVDAEALNVFRSNFRPQLTIAGNVANLVDFHAYNRGAKASFAYAPE